MPGQDKAASVRARGPTRSRKRSLMLVAVLLLALMAVYAFNPDARRYSVSAYEGIVDLVNSTFLEDEPAPNPSLVLLEKAADHIWREQWAEATAIYEQLNKMHPEAVDVWYGLGLCRHNLGDYEGAIHANLKASAEPNRYQASALYYLAAEYAMTDRQEEALDTLDQALHQGFRDIDKLRSDPALDTLRDHERFKLPAEPLFHTFTCSDGTVIEYALVLPQGFDPSKTYPALLGFPGSQQNKSVVDFGLDAYWGLQAHYQGWIVIAPIAYADGAFFIGESFRKSTELLEDVKQRFRIEGERFHVAGFSNGGTAAVKIATAYPDLFQSVTVFPCYEVTDTVRKRLDGLRGMTITLYYGEHDGGPSEETTRKLHQWLTDLDIDSTLIMIPDEGHVPMSLMGDRLMILLDTIRKRSSSLSDP